jgi:hypothetical protein
MSPSSVPGRPKALHQADPQEIALPDRLDVDARGGEDAQEFEVIAHVAARRSTRAPSDGERRHSVAICLLAETSACSRASAALKTKSRNPRLLTVWPDRRCNAHAIFVAIAAPRRLSLL